MAVVAVWEELAGGAEALPANGVVAPGVTDGGRVADVLVPSRADVGSVVRPCSAASTWDELRVAGRSSVTWSPTRPTPCQARPRDDGRPEPGETECEYPPHPHPWFASRP